MKRLSIGGIVAVLFALTSLAQSGIDVEGVANGKTVLWFSGTEVTALIESDFSVDGSLEIEGRTVPFIALGTAFGEGFGDSAAMTLDVWIVIEASGATDDGEPFSIRGGMAGSGENTDLSGSALGSAAGPFFFVVTLGTDSYRALGNRHVHPRRRSRRGHPTAGRRGRAVRLPRAPSLGSGLVAR